MRGIGHKGYRTARVWGGYVVGDRGCRGYNLEAMGYGHFYFF